MIHETAIIEENVQIGEATSIWDNVHIRHGASIGAQSIIGEKTYIAYDVKVGDRVKINAFVYVCYGVEIEDGVMVGAGTRFTNDLYPRATTPDLKHARTSSPDRHTQKTMVRSGATLGAGSVIGCGLTIGRFALVGMGSVVTKDVEDFHLVFGNPARSVGCVCRCGRPLLRWPEHCSGDDPTPLLCPTCNATYALHGKAVEESRTDDNNSPPS